MNGRFTRARIVSMLSTAPWLAISAGAKARVTRSGAR